MLTWVFGGTGVGKKEFIHRVVAGVVVLKDGLKYKPYWIEEGWVTTEAVLIAHADSSLLIRWQWGREVILKDVLKKNNGVEQKIYLLKADPEVRIQRIIKRVGFCKWNVSAFENEAQEMYKLINTLPVPRVVVDVNIDGDWKIYE